MSAKKDDMNVPLLVTLGVIGVILALVCVFGTQAYFLYITDVEAERKADMSVNYTLTDLRDQQTKNITTYRWIDRNKKIAAIPVEEAMKSLIESKGNFATALAK